MLALIVFDFVDAGFQKRSACELKAIYSRKRRSLGIVGRFLKVLDAAHILTEHDGDFARYALFHTLLRHHPQRRLDAIFNRHACRLRNTGHT